ncbi:uncharacterized protein VNE69_03366 [Vairimorpha necatrix]|uniref:Membrane protein n=1 Tax=Vairimorpha necatrix TaxID=6039 RepID=A0AAX4JB66_9MICR
MGDQDENVKNQAMEQAELAEMKVNEAVSNIEKSKLGNNLPTDIQSIHITDIIKLLIVNGIFNIFSLYLIFGTEYNNALTFIRKTLHFCFIISFFLSYVLSVACYIGGVQELYKFILFTMVVKTGIAFFLFLGFSLPSFTNIIVSLLYCSYLAFQDMVLLYYIGIYLKRLASDKYDDYGVKITNKAAEKV